jgi:hypothetical protein
MERDVTQECVTPREELFARRNSDRQTRMEGCRGLRDLNQIASVAVIDDVTSCG